MEGTPRLSAARGKRRLAELRTFARTGEHGPVVIHVQLGTHGYDIQRFLVHGAGRDWQGTSIDGRGGWAEARFPQTLEEGARLLASPAARTWEATGQRRLKLDPAAVLPRDPVKRRQATPAGSPGAG